MKANVVLLIEDHLIVAEAIKLVLLRAGIQVLVATSTLAAVATWNACNKEIGLVISDFELDATVTGEQLIQQFGSEKPQLKSILLSGHPLQTRFGGRTEGTDFFEKPFNSHEFVAAVLRLLHGSPACNRPFDRLAEPCLRPTASL